MPTIGDLAPRFALPDTTGVTQELPTAPATVLVFTCNHCPYALAWHDRLIAVAHSYSNRGVRMLAINSNDAERYPRDSPEAMRERVQNGEFDGVPYVFDQAQEVAQAYDAKTTPDVFVLDAGGVIRYRGAPDEDHDDPAQNAAWLRAALDASMDASHSAHRRNPSAAPSSGEPESGWHGRHCRLSQLVCHERRRCNWGRVVASIELT